MPRVSRPTCRRLSKSCSRQRRGRMWQRIFQGCTACGREEAAARRLRERLVKAGAQPTRAGLEQRVMDQVQSRQRKHGASLSFDAPSRWSRRTVTAWLAVAASIAICVARRCSAGWAGSLIRRTFVLRESDGDHEVRSHPAGPCKAGGSSRPRWRLSKAAMTRCLLRASTSASASMTANSRVMTAWRSSTNQRVALVRRAPGVKAHSLGASHWRHASGTQICRTFQRRNGAVHRALGRKFLPSSPLLGTHNRPDGARSIP